MHQPPEESVKEFEEQQKTIVISALEGEFQPPQETSVEILQAKEDLMKSIQTFLKKFNRISFGETPKILLLAWEKFSEIQHAKPEDIQELLHKLLKDLQIISEELSEYINCPKGLRIVLPVMTMMHEEESEGVSDDTCDVPFYDNSPPIDVLTDHFEIFSDSNDDCTSSDNDSFENIDYVEASPLEDSLIMENEELSTIPKKESDEFIKSSVEDLVLIPIRGQQCKLLMNPNLDESSFLVTPLFDFNEDECFTPGDDVDLLLHRDSSTPMISVVSILEGFTDVPPLEENDHLFDLESNKNEWKKILYDDPIDDLIFDPGDDIDEIDTFLDVDIPTDIEDGYHDSEGDIHYLESLLSDNTTLSLPSKVFLDHDPRSLNNDLKIMVKVFDPGIHKKKFSPTYETLTFEDRHYLSFTYVIRTFLPYFTYPVVSPFPLSSESEDIVFDPGISAFLFSSLEPVTFKCPMEVCSSTCFISLYPNSQ
ncbi:hypothetical protein Tco_1439945 [Tanacetum coccineum]